MADKDNNNTPEEFSDVGDAAGRVDASLPKTEPATHDIFGNEEEVHVPDDKTSGKTTVPADWETSSQGAGDMPESDPKPETPEQDWETNAHGAQTPGSEIKSGDKTVDPNERHR